MPSASFKSMRRAFIVLLFLVLAQPFQAGIPEAHAQGGSIAASGTFAGWVLEIPQGSEAGGLDRFLVVFNNTGDAMDFTMGFQGPEGIEIKFSEPQFTLNPGGQKRVLVTVIVAEDAVPGDYELRATVTARGIGTTGGVGVSTGIAQKAKVTVIGESAIVAISVLSPQGQTVVADVRLFREIREQETEVGYSSTGFLEARVSPGGYVARAYIGGESLAEESFAVAADETKEIEFIVRTVFLSDVTVTPHYLGDTTELSFITFTYTLNNLGSPVAEAEVILKVGKDNAPFDETSMLALDTLDIGSTSGSYNYIPQAGWGLGVYSFRADLSIGGRPYTSSLETEITVEPQALTAPIAETAVPATSTPTPTSKPTPTSTPTTPPTQTPVPTNTPEPEPEKTAEPVATTSPPAAVGATSFTTFADLSGKVSESGLILEKVVLVSQDQRATIEIPEGTLALNAQGEPLGIIEIRQADTAFSVPQNASILGAVYDLAPNGATFLPPLNLSIRFDPVIFSLGVSAENLAILRLGRQPADARPEWVTLESSVDTTNSIVTARTAHFTQFALAEIKPQSSSSLVLIGGIIGSAAAAVVIVTGIVIGIRNRRKSKASAISQET